MSTIKADALTTKSDNTDLTITGHGSGVPNIEAGFKVGGTAGVPTASIQNSAVTAAKLAAGVQNDVFWDAYGSSNQTGITANAITTVVYGTVASQSSHSGFNTTTGKFTIPSGYGGIYFISGFASIDGDSGSHLRSNYASIYVDGTVVGRPGYFLIDNGFEGTQTSATQVTAVTQCDAGDEVEIRVQAYANDYDIIHSRSLSGFFGFRVIAN